MTKSTNKIKSVKKIPVVLKIILVILIVMSVTGLLFFVIVGVFQIYNPSLLHDIQSSTGDSKKLDSFVLINIILHISMLISAILMLRLERMGFYLYLAVFIALILVGFVFENEFVESQIIAGVVLGLIFGIYYSRYRCKLRKTNRLEGL